ncbi:unnamed protein product [Oppiella nova]|uniref:Protein ecdysoneless n=1 Tax=Oppiella nova TaxID=334625 RepID=A0A7R9M141_9ACAR|nr:unnamed protein product [Oppiella nova]CAG2168910.1 unnamed protein product [Oppiella nova]
MALNGRITENSVLYRLYPLSECKESLNSYIRKSYTYLAKYISLHIWHNQSFQLSVATDSYEFETRLPTIREAIAYIRQNPDTTRSHDLIQKSILKRIDCFPKRIREHQHRVHCYVPIGVAALLKQRPSLISWAVNAFYSRTPDDLKACQAMKYFPPECRVMRCLTITRCLYAQLMSQQYSPDARVGWDLPPNNSRDYKSHDLGVKIASGFEILISNCKTALNGNSNQIDFPSDRRWLAFHKSLTKNGYFGKELNGSQKYAELMKSAENYFSDLIINNDENCDDFSDGFVSKGETILQILRSLEIDDKEFESEAKNLPKEDSDDWLHINGDELDAMLSEKFCSKPNQQSNDCSDLSDLSTQIPATLKAFVSNHKSGLKGAEAPKHSSRTSTAKIQFNEDSFTDALSTVLSLKIPHSDTDSSESGMSDYSDGDDSIDSDDDCYQNELLKSETTNGSTNGSTNGLMNEMNDYMKAMDQQLAETSVGQSFERRTDGHEANDGYKAVDIDLNALTNILESYSAECGVPGPATALFSTMGVKLPDDTDSDDD